MPFRTACCFSLYLAFPFLARVAACYSTSPHRAKVCSPRRSDMASFTSERIRWLALLTKYHAQEANHQPTRQRRRRLRECARSTLKDKQKKSDVCHALVPACSNSVQAVYRQWTFSSERFMVCREYGWELRPRATNANRHCALVRCFVLLFSSCVHSLRQQ